MRNISISQKVFLIVTCPYVFLLAGYALAQTPSSVVPDSQAILNLPGQPVGLDDLISVSVYGAPEVSRMVRVTRDGTIRIPMVERPIRAIGLLPADLEVSIALALKEARLLIDPVVTVMVAEYRSRPVTVMGAVNRPLKFQADVEVTVLDAISRAQGMAPNAGPEILVTRPLGEGSSVQRIALRDLMGAEGQNYNLTLRGGEEIRVPEVGKVYVVGNVKKPGLFPVQEPAGTSVLKVLAFAEGLAAYAGNTGYIYRKDDKTGRGTEIPVDVRAILHRRTPDVSLVANDVLYIPDNSGHRIAFTALEKLLLVGSASTAALIYSTSR